MSAITLRAVRRSQYWITYSPTEITWEGLMQHSPNEIKEKLLKALDKDNNVVDMGTVMEVISVLEKMQITKEALERTRLGKYINELRKRTKNELLARRAKKLVRSWQKLIIPTENPINGERIVHPSVASEPGLNCTKLGSPAITTINHNKYQRNRCNSPIRVTSPIDSYCSSTSTSPALALGYQGSSSRPSTPSVFAPKTNKTIASPDKEPPTATANALSRVNSSNEDLRHHQPPSNSSEPENNFYKHQYQRNAKTNDKVIHSSHTLNVDVVAKTNAANKRLRKENSITPSKKLCTEPTNNNNNINNCSIKMAVSTVLNGEYGDSNDSTRSIQEIDFQQNETKVPSSSETTTTRKPVKNCATTSDSLKEKLATHARTNKVKTTAQLIEELKARNTSSVFATTSLNNDKACSSRRVSPAYPHHQTVSATRRTTNNVLDGDTDMNKTKTEMMEKFLMSSVVTSDSVDGYDNNKSLASPPTTTNVDRVDPVDLIMARLPQINVDEIDWGEEDVGETDETTNDHVVSDQVLNRLHSEHWQCVNGNYDHEQTFREWHQALSLRSCNEELLHILPYVNID